MVKGPTAMNNGEPLYREIVEIEWGGYNVRGIVHEVYGLPERRRAVLVLTPELSDCIVAEPTTLSVDLTEIIRIPQGDYISPEATRAALTAAVGYAC